MKFLTLLKMPSETSSTDTSETDEEDQPSPLKTLQQVRSC